MEADSAVQRIGRSRDVDAENPDCPFKPKKGSSKQGPENEMRAEKRTDVPLSPWDKLMSSHAMVRPFSSFNRTNGDDNLVVWKTSPFEFRIDRGPVDSSVKIRMPSFIDDDLDDDEIEELTRVFAAKDMNNRMRWFSRYLSDLAQSPNYTDSKYPYDEPYRSVLPRYQHERRRARRAQRQDTPTFSEYLQQLLAENRGTGEPVNIIVPDHSYDPLVRRMINNNLLI